MVALPDPNYWRILLAFVVYMVLGFITYSPKTPSGKFWMKEIDMKPEDMQANSVHFIIHFIFSLITVWGIFVVISWYKWLYGSTVIDRMGIAFLLWLVFAVPSTYATVAFENRKVTLWELFAGYQLVGFLLIAIIL